MKAWPLIDFADIFGSFIPHKVSPALAAKAQQWRKTYDHLLTTADAALMHIAKRKVPRRLVSAVRVLTFAEIQSGRLPPRTEIEHRRYGFIFYRGRLYADMDLPSFVSTRNIIIDQVYGQRGHLRGVGIIRKQSRGQVKVVFEPSQLRKVLLGDILVAPMTTPDFVAAARKAAAIVTDEGGVTCHAAILARELNITCVVGTRIATQVLHDGDFVEVDAAKGIVRKL